MKTSFDGIGEAIVTFEAASGVAAGKPVAMSANGKVQAVTSGAFCGICRSVRNGYAAVQIGGYITVPYSGTLTVGYQQLAAATGSKVTVDTTNGREYLVVDVNSTAGTAGILL